MKCAGAEQLLRGGGLARRTEMVRGRNAGTRAIRKNVRRTEFEMSDSRPFARSIVLPGNYGSGPRGNVAVKLVPNSGDDETDMAPPWAFTMASTMYRPKPTLLDSPALSTPRTSG